MPAVGDWTTFARERLDREYNAAGTVPSVDPYATVFAERTSAVRARYVPELDVAYGEHPREKLDLFPASVAGAPLVLFVHGGYWRRFSKDDFSFVVEPFVKRGAAAAVISYPLRPEAGLDAIVASARLAVRWLHDNQARTNAASGRIVAAGHSAGGHLVGMLAATDWHAYGISRDGSVPDDSPLRAIVPISGLFDLEPIRHSFVNEWMELDEAASRRNSPILMPQPAVRLIAGVGALETSEFRRQTHAYVERWNDSNGRARAIECPNRNHFDVLYDLADDDGLLARAVMELL